MAPKPKSGKNVTPTNADHENIIPMAITRQQSEPDSCSNLLSLAV